MLCLDQLLPQDEEVQRARRRRLRAPRLHDREGPRFVPHDRATSRSACSRASSARSTAPARPDIPRGLPVYLTEFGIQSRPDRVQGVTFPKQAAYLSIAEHMAYVNPRVRSFSQYLMSDDRPRASALNKYAGFESGLRTNKGRKKPAYKAFRLPLAVENYGRTDVLGGSCASTARRRASGSRSTRGARRAGASSPTSRRRAPASTRCARPIARASATAWWTSPGGKRFSGASVRSYWAHGGTIVYVAVRPIGVLTRWADNGPPPIIRTPCEPSGCTSWASTSPT